MKTALCAGVAALSLVAASPAAAATYLFDSNNDSHALSFDGNGGDPVVNIPGLTSGLLLTLQGGIGTNALTFSYTLTKSTNVGGSDARVSGFAFDSDPNATGGSVETGEFDTVIASGGNYPNGIGGVEVCLTSSNACAGGGGGAAGAYFGDPASGSFTLTYGSSVNAVRLSDFHVRYQGLTGLNGIGSATGNEITGGVPEPSTWAMMLLGFGAVGFGLRRRKSEGNTARVRVAYA